MSTTVEQIRATLADLASRRGPAVTKPSSAAGPSSAGYDAFNHLELHGARMVEATAFEPDPKTYRGEYYYNVILNRLYRRILVGQRADGVIRAHWVACSE